MSKRKSERPEQDGLFKPPGSSRWIWRRKYKGRKLGGPTGETDRDRAWKFAEAEFAEQKRLIDEELKQGRAPMTVETAFTKYVESLVGKPGAEPAARELAWVLDVVDKMKVNMQVREFTQTTITEIRNARCASTTSRDAGYSADGEPLEKLVSAATVNRTMQTVRAALYHARDHHKAFLAPDLKFGITKEPTHTKEVSEEQEAVLLDHLRQDFHEIFAFALLSGIRAEGVVTLERDNVNLRNGEVRFRSKRHRTDPPGFVRWETQPLGPVELALLSDIMERKDHPKYVFTYIAKGKKGGKGGTGHGGEYVAGKRYPITAEQLTTRWQRDRAKAAKVMPAVADANWHLLRHTFATRLLRDCHDLAKVQRALGHATLAATMRYAHVLNDDVRKAKAQVQDAQQNTSPTVRKVQGLVQGRPNLKVVG